MFEKMMVRGLSFVSCRRSSLWAVLAVAAVAVAYMWAAPVARGDYVYNLVNFPSDQNGWNVSGQIVTDTNTEIYFKRRCHLLESYHDPGQLHNHCLFIRSRSQLSVGNLLVRNTTGPQLVSASLQLDEQQRLLRYIRSGI